MCAPSIPIQSGPKAYNLISKTYAIQSGEISRNSEVHKTKKRDKRSGKACLQS